MISLLNDRYKLTNHIWKWKEDLIVNLLTFQPPILTCIEPDLNLIPFMKGLKRPHSIYISPKCGDLQIKLINHARTFDCVLTGMKMKIKLLFTEKDTFREKFEKKIKVPLCSFVLLFLQILSVRAIREWSMTLGPGSVRQTWSAAPTTRPARRTDST